MAVDRPQMKPTVRRIEEFEWVDLPGHLNGALTKLLVTTENSGTPDIDVFLSSYAPQGYAEEHHHETMSEVFYFLGGSGLFVLDGERHVVGAGTVVFVPPMTRHAIYNTGFEPLTFLVTGSPPDQTFHERYSEYFVAGAD
ncbi:MAG: cupin domain-containing protein [Acidimicrobiales bacterium]